MALFDDRRFLLSHINHSFITGDDTGICEVVMLDEDVFENQHQRCLKLEGQSDNENPEDRLDPEAYDLNYESELFESEQGQSYDIASDLDYICHRRRSNTAQRLDRLKKEKINQSKTRTIVWRCNSPTGSQSEDHLSVDSPSLGESTDSNNKSETDAANATVMKHRRSRSPPRKSGLTKLLEKFPSLPKNPFDEFAQFEGGMSETVPVKKIMIFIAINQQQNPNQQQQNQSKAEDSNKYDTNFGQNNQSIESSGIGSANGSKDINKLQENNLSPRSIATGPQMKPKHSGPLEVVIVSTAKVQDLIGLICWQYTNEGREPKLHQDISRYCLRIAEDNGEVDPDFTSLNPREPLSKFNFPSLALTEKTEERVRSHNERYANGDVYNQRLPTIAQNVMTSSTKISSASGRFAALTRIIFKDAKLDANQ